MPYRITLVQNTDARQPAAVEVVYTFAAGPQVWGVVPVTPVPNTSVISVNCAAHDLVNQPGVQTRVMRLHYPTVPNTMDIQISSVMS